MLFTASYIFHFLLVYEIVEPDPPEHANLTFPLNTVCRYDWVPPNGNVIGNIGGYNLSYEGDCGICSPIGMVNSSTFTAECRGWIANGQTCYFEVTTFTEDCGFYSTTSTNVTSILDSQLLDRNLVLNNYIIIFQIPFQVILK